MKNPPEFITIGVYGATESQFYDALLKAGVDTFYDVRNRGGMRGRKYAFVNSTYLQNRLREMGIRYAHIKELSPTPEIRQLQKQADKSRKTAKRQRTALSPEFTAAYQEQILQPFDWQAFLKQIPDDAQVIALFCVERDPSACHRSLIAEYLKQEFNFKVKDIIP